jgi:hypothetical protein
VIRAALASDKPTLMDFIVSPLEKVSPMVPAGAALGEILELEWCEESDIISLQKIIDQTCSSLPEQEECL